MSNETNQNPTTLDLIPAQQQVRRPGQIDNLYNRRDALKAELAQIEDAIAQLERNPEVLEMLKVVTRALANVNRDPW